MFGGHSGGHPETGRAGSQQGKGRTRGSRFGPGRVHGGGEGKEGTKRKMVGEHWLNPKSNGILSYIFSFLVNYLRDPFKPDSFLFFPVSNLHLRFPDPCVSSPLHPRRLTSTQQHSRHFFVWKFQPHECQSPSSPARIAQTSGKETRAARSQSLSSPLLRRGFFFFLYIITTTTILATDGTD